MSATVGGLLYTLGAILLLLKEYINRAPQREAQKEEAEHNEVKKALASRDVDYLARDIDRLRDRKKPLPPK